MLTVSALDIPANAAVGSDVADIGGATPDPPAAQPGKLDASTPDGTGTLVGAGIL